MSALDLIKLGVAVIILIAFIEAVFILKSSGSSLVASFSEKMSDTYTRISESDRTRYDNTVVSGADVVNAVRGYGELEITVITMPTRGTTKSVSYSKNFVASANDVNIFLSYGVTTPSDENYINPYARFKGEVLRNSNGALYGMKFTQVEYVDSAIAHSNITTDGSSGVIGGGGSSGAGGSNAELINLMTEAVTQMSATNQTLNLLLADSDSFAGGLTQTDLDDALAEIARSIEVSRALEDVMNVLGPLQTDLTASILGHTTDKNGNDELGPTLAVLAESLKALEAAMDNATSSGDSQGGSAGSTDGTLDGDETVLSTLREMTTMLKTISEVSNDLQLYVKGGYLDANGADASINARLTTLYNQLEAVKTSSTTNSTKLDAISGKLDDIQEQLDRIENTINKNGTDS